MKSSPATGSFFTLAGKLHTSLRPMRVFSLPKWHISSVNAGESETTRSSDAQSDAVIKIEMMQYFMRYTQIQTERTWI